MKFALERGDRERKVRSIDVSDRVHQEGGGYDAIPAVHLMGRRASSRVDSRTLRTDLAQLPAPAGLVSGISHRCFAPARMNRKSLPKVIRLAPFCNHPRASWIEPDVMPNGIEAAFALRKISSHNASTSGVRANAVHCLAPSTAPAWSAGLANDSPGLSMEKAKSFGPTKTASIPGTSRMRSTLRAASSLSICMISVAR